LKQDKGTVLPHINAQAKMLALMHEIKEEAKPVRTPAALNKWIQPMSVRDFAPGLPAGTGKLIRDICFL
jgi:hypothetical protein